MTYEEQLKIVQAAAIYACDKDVMQMIKDFSGKDITRDQVNHYRYSNTWQPMRDKYREEFEAKISDEPLASKRKRIQELAKAYERLSPNEETLPEAVSVLSKIREEIEGKTSGGMNLTQYNQYNGLSDEDLRKVIAENTRFLEIAEKRKKEITVEINGEGP